MRKETKHMSEEDQEHLSQHSLWSSSEVAERWQQDIERRRVDFAEATQRMLEAAGLEPGHHVLDIAAGTGDQSILAARRVGPGGKLAALVWSAPENNPLFSLPLAIVATYARGASSHGPDPFALSDPRVFERELTEAGFDEVITRALPFESHYASLDAFLQSTASRLTAGVMGQLRKPEQQQLLGEVRQALSQFEGSHGLVAPAEFLLGVGSKERRRTQWSHQ